MDAAQLQQATCITKNEDHHLRSSPPVIFVTYISWITITYKIRPRTLGLAHCCSNWRKQVGATTPTLIAVHPVCVWLSWGKPATTKKTDEHVVCGVWCLVACGVWRKFTSLNCSLYCLLHWILAAYSYLYDTAATTAVVVLVFISTSIWCRVRHPQ